ncbi:MAG: hypothetical protein CL555_02395 [Algoriphagus sp.]|nr:hypothetical protein [Algoriphagus sp.]
MKFYFYLFGLSRSPYFSRMKAIFLLFLLLSPPALIAQTGYKDEMGRDVSREYFENQILEGPYFGIPDGEGGKILVHRMPFGKVDPQAFFEKTGNLDALNQGKSLIVIFYPGQDECNSTGSGDRTKSFEKEHKTLIKWAVKANAAPPIYLYSNPSGLERFKDVVTWKPDPDGVFSQTFFRYPYPCGSFVVIHPSGEFRGILGGYPLNQIQVALKKLQRANR